MVDRKARVTQSTPPSQAAGSAQANPDAESNQTQGNSPGAIGGKAETGRHSSQSADSQFATNRADPSDADDPNEA